MPNLRYTARARPHNLQRRFTRIRSRGGILTLSGVRLLASSFAICLRNLTFCASVVMVFGRFCWFSIEQCHARALARWRCRALAQVAEQIGELGGGQGHAGVCAAVI